MKALPRLTPAMLLKAERGGKVAGWYQLCRQGYLPGEVALHAEPTITQADFIHAVRSHADAKDLPVPASCARRRTRNQAAPPEDWRAAFRSNVMRTGMVLALTQPMLEMLCATADGVIWDRGRSAYGGSLARPCSAIVTAASLEKRGLLRRMTTQEFTKREDDDAYHVLTGAGLAVVELLKAVGVFIQADAAIARKVGG